MKCHACGQEVPEEALYCPFCTAGDHVRETRRRALWGAAMGFLAGVLPGLMLLWIYGPLRGIKGIALVLPIAGLATGYVLGLVSTRKDEK